MKFRIHYWPIVTTAWMCLTFVMSYTITVSRGEAYAVFPYISDTGTLPPASCIFGLMLSIGAVLMLVTMYFRYRYVEIKKEELSKSTWKWNKISLYVGYIACFGMAMVASFPETANIAGHLIGAHLAFYVGPAYFIIQAYITWKLSEDRCTKWIRIILGASLVPLAIMVSVFSTISMNKLKVSKIVDILWWTSDKPGYTEHLVATFSEWLLALNLVLFIFSYTSEFKEIEYGGVQILSRSFSPMIA